MKARLIYKSAFHSEALLERLVQLEIGQVSIGICLFTCTFQHNEQLKELVLRKNNLGDSGTRIGEALGTYNVTSR